MSCATPTAISRAAVEAMRSSIWMAESATAPRWLTTAYVGAHAGYE